MGRYFLKILLAVFVCLDHTKVSVLGLKWPSESSHVKCREKERQALLNFKQSVEDQYGMLSTWKDDENNRDCCGWEGIECNNETGHVEMLDLRGSESHYLSGSFNITSLLDLQNLEYLDLSSHPDISGSQIPEQMGSFRNLRYLNLSYSRFIRGIPSQLGNLSKLKYLDLKETGLDETIPSQLGKLSNLQYLDLGRTDLDGEVPSQLGNLSHLMYLDLSGNSFFGALPFQVGNLPLLHYLRLDGSYGLKLKDGHWLSSLSSLTTLGLYSFSNLSFSPYWLSMIREHIPNLRELSLVDCDISDDHISSLFPFHSNISTSLSILDLSHNMLTSSTFQLLSNYSPNLQELHLSSNKIVLSSPHYPNLPSLVILDLSENNLNIFQGNLNFSTKLQNLNLRYCNLTDESFVVSSDSIKNPHSLVTLDLSSNLLKSSSVFHWLFNFTTNLESLSLSFNLIEGPIPVEFGKAMNFLEVLDFSGNKLQGEIPASLGSICTLKNLDLNNNMLEGPIPVEFGKVMNSLKVLDLSGNKLQGEIPASLGSICTLKKLDLHDNMLEGLIPVEFGKVMNFLEGLDLAGNKLQGKIPASLGSICTLKDLDLSHNNLSGEISSFIQNSSRCKNPVLEDLNLSNNVIIGKLPNLSTFSSLRYLDLSNNQLTGEIPKSIGFLYELRSLHLEENYLKGDINELDLTNLWKLMELDLSDNSLSLTAGASAIPPFQLFILGLASCKLGPSFPSWLQDQRELRYLDISDAGIDDFVPDWFWNNIPTITQLNMSYNSLKGPIPNLTMKFLNDGTRKAIILNSNKFEGVIPTFLSHVGILDLSENKFSNLNILLCENTVATNMFTLDLSNNQIAGQLPDCWEHLSSLRFLDLRNNKLSGKIPQSLGSLVTLEALVLRNNSFIGELPLTLKNCSSLALLDVSKNMLSGEVPSWIGESMPQLKILSLRVNRFFGSVPVHLCYLRQIQVLDLSRNNLSGEIPTCLANFTTLMETSVMEREIVKKRQISVLEYHGNSYDSYLLLSWKGQEYEFWNPENLLKSIDLSSNDLIGEVPKEVGYLLGLVSLNLSRNNFHGKIPSSIGNLSSLEFLDLSRNNFSGNIPFTLPNIDSLGVLDLSNNNLSGRIPRGRHFETFDASCFEGNVDLCGEQLNKSCPGDETMHKPQEPAIDGEEEDNSIFCGALYMSLGLGFFAGFWGLFGSMLFWQPWRISYLRFLNRLIDYILLMAELNVVKCHRWLKG
ncbi:hypothetical protein ACSQ67_008855 [Phaseolus vulgaris]